jgi:hypothetical protein
MEQTAHCVESSMANAEGKFIALEQWLVSSTSFSLPLHEVEVEEWKQGREILRLLLQEHLDARGAGDVGPAIQVAQETSDGPVADGG